MNFEKKHQLSTKFTKSQTEEKIIYCCGGVLIDVAQSLAQCGLLIKLNEQLPYTSYLCTFKIVPDQTLIPSLKHEEATSD